ncbi:Integrase, catalytic core domain and Ribonuclease H-like domain-containing protein [Strongyloides ratti]|uniref:Integrase, catalytic core domain and Ribonuclease H-like domain-containing protein n=1 Tax=Strongyloides ratti TaxID=34506 RepID=A0A090KQL1_STRRB|nr:Integrase, catalytic core domain and Ribonuclease H-like domain-containing protein [Strongyloides ratti]CEF59664.1 Integrase, catalytic core domain and Ribonuclease H-like domain-containing protein [Strongyloides ratti]
MRNRRIAVSSWLSAECPMERFHADVFEYVGRKFLIVVDSFSSFIMLRLLKNISSNATKAALENIFATYSKTAVIVCDNATNFASQDILEYFMDNKIYPSYAVPRHSQNNGTAEVAVRLIKQYLKSKEIKNIDESVLNAAMLFVNSRTMVD